MGDSKSKGDLEYTVGKAGGLVCPDCEIEHVIYDAQELQQGLKMCPRCLGSSKVTYEVIKAIEEVLARQIMPEAKRFVPPKWLTVK